jgi:single-strand DNA-binding protein
MYINKAIIYGNLTRDPEMRALPSGIQVASFSVATNRVWKDKNGAKQESSDFHNVVVFGKQADIINQYLKKGSGIYVEGRMQTRSWDGPDGQKKYRTEIIADSFQFGPRSGGQGGGSSASAPRNEGNQSSSKVDKAEGIDTIDYPEEEINPEDIPF